MSLSSARAPPPVMCLSKDVRPSWCWKDETSRSTCCAATAVACRVGASDIRRTCDTAGARSERPVVRANLDSILEKRLYQREVGPGIPGIAR